MIFSLVWSSTNDFRLKKQATAEAGYLITYKDLVNFYVDSMQKLLIAVEYFKEADLESNHQRIKNEAIEQVSRFFK